MLRFRFEFRRHGVSPLTKQILFGIVDYLLLLQNKVQTANLNVQIQIEENHGKMTLMPYHTFNF